MNKISTKEIRALIPTWLGTDALKEDLKDYYVTDSSSPESLKKYGGYFKAEPPHSVDQVRETIWNQFISGDEWKREEKHKIGEEWETYMGYDSPGDADPAFFHDFAGGCDSALVKKYADDPKLAETCIYRMFIPKGQLGDNFRLEVVSTPDDSEIIGWVVVVD